MENLKCHSIKVSSETVCCRINIPVELVKYSYLLFRYSEKSASGAMGIFKFHCNGNIRV